MPAFLAVVLWSVLFSYVIYRLIRNQTTVMTWAEVILVFTCKVLLGCLYGYIFLHFYGGSDTWALHANSVTEKQMLINDPLQFFWEFTPATAIINGTGIFETAALYLADLEYCLQAKTLGIINLISNDNYFVNVVFWNFILFWGHYWLFSLLIKHFPARRTLYFILVFLFPPAIFWLSGIRSDGLIFLSLSLLLLHFYQWVSTGRMTSVLLWVIGLTGVLIMRPPVAALLIPALCAWWLCTRFSQKPLVCFFSVYLVAAAIFFGSGALSSRGFPGIVVQKQQEFMQLRGSRIQLDSLHPHLKSFVRVLPQAAKNTYLRPHAFEAKGMLQVIAAIEVILFWALFLLVLVKHDRRWYTNFRQPLNLVFIFFGVSFYLFIGYTIPFPGAIVRYKIIPELLMFSTMVSCLHPKFYHKNYNKS
jgi:hypothetical protein